MPSPLPNAAALRQVHLISPEADIFKALYFDPSGLRLRPNLTFVDDTGRVIFESNEAGLKGDPIDPRRKLAVIWGDSVAFSTGRGWPCLIDHWAPGYQFLNGGIDGDPYDNILRRARHFNAEYPVALNLLMLGWHPFLPERVVQRPRRPWSRLLGDDVRETRLGRAGNSGLDRALADFLVAVPNTVVLTMPTALNPALIDTDLSRCGVDGDDEVRFSFLGRVPYRPDGPRQGLEHIVERNAMTRAVCAAHGVRVVDLYAVFDTAGLSDFRQHFCDIVHFRPPAYSLVARIVYDAIADLLTS